jgi:hypothetical protein
MVSINDACTDETPFLLTVPKSKSDYGGNDVYSAGIGAAAHHETG